MNEGPAERFPRPTVSRSGVVQVLVIVLLLGSFASRAEKAPGYEDYPEDHNGYLGYGIVGGWYLGTSPLVTANWAAERDNRWTVRLGGGFGRVFRIGNQAYNASLQGFYDVETPDDFGADWSIRVPLQLLCPRV